MAGKAELTTQYILETVAPVFNRYGYAATSMSDLTRATKLTKGAIYGNFESKEDLAIQSFNYNIRKIIGLIAEKMNAEETPIQKLQALTNFYRNYYSLTKKYGGCPLLNVGVDSKHQNPQLLKRVKEVIRKLQTGIANIIREGITQKQFKKTVDPEAMALRIFSQIEGGIFVTNVMDDNRHMIDVMNHIDLMIETEMLL
jgi:TetR/AcrR family transcriptional regulator, transcriptional repressor for nem operon